MCDGSEIGRDPRCRGHIYAVGPDGRPSDYNGRSGATKFADGLQKVGKAIAASVDIWIGAKFNGRPQAGEGDVGEVWVRVPTISGKRYMSRWLQGECRSFCPQHRWTNG